jgi:hypothetical protein
MARKLSHDKHRWPHDYFRSADHDRGMFHDDFRVTFEMVMLTNIPVPPAIRVKASGSSKEGYCAE